MRSPVPSTCFRRLAPARMRHLRVHIGPEAIFLGPSCLPEAHRALRGEAHPHDALDRLEAILPRQVQAERRAHGVGQRLAIGARHHERQIVHRLRHGDALDIGPGIAGEEAVLLARRHVRLVEGLEAQELGIGSWAWRSRPGASAGSPSTAPPSTRPRRSGGDRCAPRASPASADRRCRWSMGFSTSPSITMATGGSAASRPPRRSASRSRTHSSC